MSSDDVAIRVEGLSKSYHIYDRPKDRLLQMLFRGRRRFYREFWALQDVSFTVRRGETVGIVGRNGSGKSTLLQLICGTLHPTAGTVQVKGRVAALLELGAGFNPEFSGRDNVYLAASLYGLNREQIDARFDKIAAFADIGDFIEQPVKTYSSGMYVRLAFAVIAHVDADILIIDEALAVGDAIFTQKCMRFLRTFKQQGVLLFVSHDSISVKALCDNALWLDGGRPRLMDSAKNVTEAYLEYVYLSQNKEEVQTPESFDEPLASPDDSASVLSSHSDKSFGIGGARIRSTQLIDQNGKHASCFAGEELVRLQIDISITADIRKPIVGFFFKDRTGQVIFGENTYEYYKEKHFPLYAADELKVAFEFAMPCLACGEYTIGVAIADGTQQEHVQHHWIHDILIIKFLNVLPSTGLVKIPMSKINMATINRR
ncbi:MAG: ABC transporter ATP-binding protein [Burkholderiaceae bacterium]|jgi:lipopolysaccharide transport system ATP-binding protein